jgi:hypothetical protein
MLRRRLASHEIRATPLVGFIPAGAVAVVLGIVAGRQPTGAEFRYLPLRLAVVSLVCAVCFVLDDQAKTFSDPAANPLRIRRGIRALTGVLVASGLFVIALIPASDGMSLVVDANQAATGATDTGEGPIAQPELPWGRLALEMATMIGLSLAIAGAVALRGDAEPGRLASGILLGAYALSWMIPEGYKPWADPLDRRWTTGAKWWWAALILVWVSALIFSWDSRVGRSLLHSAFTQDRATR